MSEQLDVAVVGGGIVGLAFAWEAARRGRRVMLFERSRLAQGASVRNFGMIWPIGQKPGADYARALRSRERWIEVIREAGLWAAHCGSLHAVYEADEDRVLQEFVERASPAGIPCEYLNASATVKRFPVVNSDRLRSSLFSPTEMAIDPRQVIARLPLWLEEKHGVMLRYDTTVTHVDGTTLRTAGGETFQARQVFVCSGADFETLFPAVYQVAGFRRCKLQMLRTPPQPGEWKLGPHFAGGLTLTHYKSFEVCPSLQTVKARVAAAMPEFVKYGIHVMASQNGNGEVIIGDSHEYDADIGPFDNPMIDDLILKYLRTLVKLPDETIAARWHGVYAKHPTLTSFTAEPYAGCTIIASPGGAGMTLSFGVARDWFDVQEAR